LEYFNAWAIERAVNHALLQSAGSRLNYFYECYYNRYNKDQVFNGVSDQTFLRVMILTL
jgi:hypothetical protein